MSPKRLTVFTAVLMLLSLVAASVSASDSGRSLNAPAGRYLAQSSVVQEASGLDASAIMSALQDGSSVAQLIAANDADIDAVIASLVEEASAQINESKDGAISQLPDVINQQLDRRWHWRHQSRSPVFISMFHRGAFPIASAEAGEGETQESLDEGASLLDLIEANGGDVDGLMADLVTEATAQIEAFAAAQIDGLDEYFREQLDATSADSWRRRWRFRWPRLPRLPLPNQS